MGEGIQDDQPGGRARGHGDGDGPVGLHDWGGSYQISSAYSSAICCQSLSRALTAAGWQAAVAAYS